MSVKSVVLAKLFGSSVQAINKWKRDNRPVIVLLNQYFETGDIEEFLEKGKITKFEKLNNFSLQAIEDIEIAKLSLSLLEDHARYTLREKLEDMFRTIFGLPDVAKYFPKKVFVEIVSDLHMESYNHDTAKDLLLQRLKGYETSLRKLEHPNHVKIIHEFVNEKLSKIEVYVLVKNYREFFK